jgi:hypothetical protein
VQKIDRRRAPNPALFNLTGTAMKRPVFATLLTCLGVVTLIAGSPLDGKRWWSYVKALANDDMKGRDTGTPEYLRAARYVASEFEKAGLKPAAESGPLQPVKFRTWKIAESESSLSLLRDGTPEPLTLGEDAFFARLKPVEAIEAPLVFLGYGLTV